MTRRLNRYVREQIDDVLEALGTETMDTSQIVKGLTIWSPNRRELTWFIKKYMQNRFVSKQRNYYGADKIVTWTAIVR